MPEIKIGVSAGVDGVDQAISKITQKMNALAAAVGKSQGLKVEPTDMKTMARDLELINKQFAQTLALSAQVRNALKNSGQSGLHISQVDWTKTSTDPRAAQRLRDRAFLHTVRGTSLDPTLANEVDSDGNIVAPAPGAGGAGGSAGGSGGAGGGGSGRRPPRGTGGASGGGGGEESGGGWGRKIWRGFGKGVGAFGRGAGGGAGAAGEVAEKGIEAGVGAAEGAGMMGMARVAGPAALAFMAYKGAEALGRLASEGMDLAKQQNESADLLKRNIGDLGVSFKELTGDSRYFGQQIGVSGGEFLKLEQQANAASGGLYRTPKDLAEATRSGGDLARAYGLQPSQGVNFVAGMDRLNNRQNNKELATQLAQAIISAQGKATPGEVMQAMQGFASQQNAFNSINPNLDMFGSAYGSMLRSGSDMTADHASSILGTANSSMQHMGGTEASKNFLMQQFGMDPIRAQLRAEGGLFANGLDNKDVAGFMSQRGIKDWESQYKGPSGSNIDVTMQGLDKAYSGRGQYGYEMELDAVKNMFGLKSLGDAASLANASTSDRNGIASDLKNAGVNLSDVREGGLQAISGISKANSFSDLDKLYRSGPDAIRDRKDMQPSDIAALDKAEQSNNFDEVKNAMVRVLAGKGQEDTQATTQRSIDANIENIKSQIGERLVPYAQKAMEGILWMVNKAGAGISAPMEVTDPNFMGPPGSAKVGGDTSSDRSLPQAIADSHASRADVDGLHTATGDTAWDKILDAGSGMSNAAYGRGVGKAYGYRDNVSDGMSQIMGAGIDKAHASAIMASAIRESSMGPAAGHKGSYGLFQFDENRAKDFQRVTGKSLYGSSQKDQIDYMVQSMQKGGEEAGPGAAFWASNGKDAARVFSDKIERPKEKSKEGDIRSGIADSLNDGDFVINLHQTVTTPGGATKTKTMSAKVPKPTSSGSRNQTIHVPG